jgi:3'-phosphoadenosine 5'-phosphosulfate sulfotransferase (PAPS reductase)/FAD synthetase
VVGWLTGSIGREWRLASSTVKVRGSPPQSSAHSPEELVKILSQHRFTVLFSGGKDSAAALLWVIDNVPHKNWNILYVEVAGNTHPACTEYAVKFCRSLGVGEKLTVARTDDFYDLMYRWGPPLPYAYRWCLRQLKQKIFRSSSYWINVSGIKLLDSNRRARMDHLNYVKATGKLSVLPLFNWTEKQVSRYIKEHGVPVNPCYGMYGHSGNCMFCPYADRRHVLLTMSDPFWRGKIMGALTKHREKLMRGSIGRLIYKRWVEASSQTTLQAYVQRQPSI